MPPAIQDTAAQAVASETERLEAVEQILLREARGEGKATIDEEIFLRNALGGDERRLESERGRIRRVVELQRKAGTAQELAAAEKRVEAADEVLRTRGAEIAEQIAALQREQADIESEAATAHRSVEDMRTAREALCRDNLLPKRVVFHINVLRRAIATSQQPRLGEVQHQIDQIEQMSRWSPRSPVARSYCETNGMEDFLLMRGNMYSGPYGGPPEVNPTKWAKFIEGKRQALPDLHAKRQAILDESEPKREEIEQLQRRYVPR